MKTCGKCGESKPLSDFYRYARAKSGYMAACKPCYTGYRAKVVANLQEIAKSVVPEDFEKRCSQCGESKPYSAYFKHSGTKDGLRPDCKACLTAKQKAHYERKKPEKLAWQREYNRRNAERVRRAHHDANLRRRQDPEWAKQQREKGRAYDNANRDRRAVTQLRRIARIARASVNDFTYEQWLAIKASYGDRCAYCGIETESLVQEHVIPISKHGPHTARNIVPACRPCNTRKASGPAPPFRVIPTSFVA